MTTVNLSALQQAGLTRDLAEYNAANPEAQLSLDGFVQAIVVSHADAAVRKHSALPPFEFVSRFTPAEFAAITKAAKTSPDVAGYLDKLKAASSVDLTHQLVTDGLALLEQAGLIAAGRAAEISAI